MFEPFSPFVISGFVAFYRLEAELVRTREELSTIKERAARELAQLAQKCATFQETQKKWVERRLVLPLCYL